MKRSHEKDDEESLIVFKKMKTEENKRSFKKFNTVADIMFGNFLKGTNKLLTVERPPTNNNQNLKTFLKLTLRGRYNIDELDGVKNDTHRVIDVYNNLERYNTVYYLTQKKEVTFSMSPDMVETFLETTIDEIDFIKELFGEGPPRFNAVYPMYCRGMITDIRFGSHAVMSVLEYFKSHDRKHIFFNETDKCKELLKWCVDIGLANNVENVDHPPIPTSSRFHRYNCSIGSIISVFQIPEPNFATISYVCAGWDEYDCEFDKEDCGDIYPISELPDDDKGYTLITCDYKLSGVSVNNKKIKYFNDVPAKNAKHTYIFVFKNNTDSKHCGNLDHCLVKGITRLQSYAKYLREHVIKSNKAIFKKYVMKY